MKIKKRNLIIILLSLTILGSVIPLITYILNYDYHKNAVVWEYPFDEYEGIKIPGEVTLYFVSNANSLKKDIRDLFLKEGHVILGKYRDNEIHILFNQGQERMRRTIVHELAHHEHLNNLSDIKKKQITSKYEEYCDGELEFYAETIESYGWFDFG